MEAGTTSEPYRVLVTGAAGAVMSLRHFKTADMAAEFCRGVMVGYWWRPVSLEYDPAKRTTMAGAPQALMEVRWHDEILVSRGLQELTADHLKPLTELWRRPRAVA